MPTLFSFSDSEEKRRPQFPKKAVITAGMPYGNKGLHFGHVGGVFVPADVWARFLRDRLGFEQVIFVSGTDCYGSPIAEGYRKAQEQGFEGTIEDYVLQFHTLQKESLSDYDISLNLFAASALGPAKDIHQDLSYEILERLYEQDELEKRSSLQFYDAEAEVFLNGRQVQGRCPIQGCKSEKAYADECDLGHQFEPADLIAPISQLTGTKPILKEVDNFYFKLPAYRNFLLKHCSSLKEQQDVRPVVSSTIEEFLGQPGIFLKNESEELYQQIKDELPPHEFQAAEKGKTSFKIIFEDNESCDKARQILAAHDLRYRTSKTLVPFRLTGNIEWGVKAPKLEGSDKLTIWVWPESLWAPISFTQCNLQERGSSENWKDWWCTDDSRIYQFIGQDNIYFYGIAQAALFEALNWELKQSTLIANHHILFLGSKASSSGAIKPPLASELLEHYSAEQLRSHWISLGLDKKSVSFQPKVYDEKIKDDPRVADPALKESALLTNIFNRLARSVFYGLASECSLKLPALSPDPQFIEYCKESLLRFEEHMSRFEFTQAFGCADEFIREANKRWSAESKAARSTATEEGQEALINQKALEQALINAAYALRFASLMMHPIVPKGCALIAQYFQIPEEILFDWALVDQDFTGLIKASGLEPSEHLVKELLPRTDFFRKHESQY